MNQSQRILNSNAPVHHMTDRSYKGKQPEFATIIDPLTGVEKIVKTSKGVPFVRVAS